jgi:hypothetical protein
MFFASWLGYFWFGIFNFNGIHTPGKAIHAAGQDRAVKYPAY